MYVKLTPFSFLKLSNNLYCNYIEETNLLTNPLNGNLYI